MKVILRQTVENLGKPGDVVRVKPGYAHNYLIPQQMALPVTDGNIRRIENEKHQLALREAKLKSDAEAIAEQIGGTKLVFEKKAGLEGVLYGSVTTAEIAEALDGKGLSDVDKRHLILPEAIKHIGEFKASLRLHPEVTMDINVLVKSEDGMAEKAMAEAAVAHQEMAAEQAAAMEELSGAPKAEEAAAETAEAAEAADTAEVTEEASEAEEAEKNEEEEAKAE